MIYKTANDWLNDPHKKVLLFGMSGLGKTHVSNMLRASGNWFHYSVDYRIGTRYLGNLLKTHPTRIGSNISFDNLEPLATYLGKPGDPAKGGLEFGEYMRRQKLHEKAEIAALLDTVHFMTRARDLNENSHFVCDSGGSICEVVDPDDENDPVLKTLSDNLLLVWIKGTDDHRAKLVQRFNAAPKPMYYRTGFLSGIWNDYIKENTLKPDQVDPDKFVRWAYAQALSRRQPRYQAMAQNWGVTVSAADVAKATTPAAFDAMVAQALEKRAA